MASGARPIIYQERKRLAFVAAMAFVAGFLFYIRTDLQIAGIHISFFTGGLYAVVVGACALIVCILLPSLRFMIEAVAVSRLILSLFVLIAPNLGYAILANPLLTALVTVAGGVAVSRLMHGRLERDAPEGLRDRIVPRNMFKRLPVKVEGTQWQKRFVGWLEDVEPTTA
jgi:hypothetical protein